MPEPSAGRWTPTGTSSTRLATGRDGVRAFTCGLVVRGFDIDEGLPLDLGKAVAGADLRPSPLGDVL